MRNKKEPLLIFSITATLAEKQRIDEAAQAAGLPRATFIRKVVSAYIASQIAA